MITDDQPARDAGPGRRPSSSRPGSSRPGSSRSDSSRSGSSRPGSSRPDSRPDSSRPDSRPDSSGPDGRSDSTTARLLACGAVAGPLFVAVALVQGATRVGFEWDRHALSQLSMGDLGWIQIANFIVGGALFVVAAVGLRTALGGLTGGRWGPRLIGAFGVCLIAGGVFVADPAFGFPPGTPPGAPEQLSWHGVVHGFAPALGFLALVIACFVLARTFAALRRPGWSAYSVVTGVAILPLSVWPNLGETPEGRFVPLWVAMVLGFGWASAVAVRFMVRGAAARDEIGGEQ